MKSPYTLRLYVKRSLRFNIPAIIHKFTVYLYSHVIELNCWSRPSLLSAEPLSARDLSFEGGGGSLQACSMLVFVSVVIRSSIVSNFFLSSTIFNGWSIRAHKPKSIDLKESIYTEGLFWVPGEV